MLKVEEHSKASVETARLDMGTSKRIAGRKRLEAMVADLEVEAMGNIAITARPKATIRMGVGSSILNGAHSSTRA